MFARCPARRFWLSTCWTKWAVLLGLALLHRSTLVGQTDDTPVPSVVGLSASDASILLKAAGLSAKLEIGDAATEPGQVFEVYRQTPAADAHVASGSQVRLLLYGPVAKGMSGDTKASQGKRLPNLAGKTAQEAKATLVELGLACRFQLGPPAPSPKQSMTVCGQEPAAGSQVSAGDTVTLTIHAQSSQVSEPTASPPTNSTMPSETEPASPPSSASKRVGRRQAADHSVDGRNRLTAVDLTHGDGLSRLAVRRVWLGDKTLNQHLGAGWSDPNVVRLSRLSDDTVLLFRGGAGWQLAHRDGDQFSLPDGLTLDETDNGWLVQSPRGGRMTFDAEGRLATVESRHGPVMQLTYDENGRLTEVGLGPGNTLHYHYGPGGRVSRIEGPESLVVHYEYDADGRLIAVTNSRNVRVEYRYTEGGDLSTAGDMFGNTWTPTPSDETPSESLPDRSEESDVAAVDPNLNEPDVVLNDQGLIAEVRYGNQAVSCAYECCGRVSEIHVSAGTVRLEYDAFGRRTAIKNLDGTTTRVAYNPLGLPVRIENSDGSWATFEYNQHGDLTATAKSSGTWERWEYDQHGRTVTYQTSPQYEERYEYDGHDRLVAVFFSTGNEVRYQYDASGNIIEEHWASGERTRWRFDETGWCEETVGPLGLVTQYGHEDDGQSLWIADGLHGRRTIRTSRDARRRLVLDWDGVGSASVLTDRYQRPIETVSPSGESVRYVYDDLGRMSAVLDASGASWQYAHDTAGRLNTILGPSGVSTLLQYNQFGHPTHVRRADIDWRQYVNDPSGRLRVASSPAGMAALYQYDEVGRVREMTIPDGNVQYRYDESGQLVSVTGPYWTLQQTYHPDGQLARQKYDPAGLELEFPLDQFGRSAGIRLNETEVGYHYDERGQLDRIALPGGASIGLESDETGRVQEIRFAEAARLSVAYDRLDRVVELKASGSAGLAILSERYTYDRAGNLVELQTGNRGSTQFAYDKNGQLIQTGTKGKATQFTYDVDGNLQTISGKDETVRWDLDDLGRPTREGTQRFFTWDKSGNLSGVRNTSSYEDNEFDAAGQLVRREKDGELTTYGYLPDGDRLWKYDEKGTCWYAYLPDGLVGMKDAAGITWLVVTLPGTDWPLALCGSDGTIRFLIADRLRSIRRTLDLSGQVVSKSDYGPWGDVILQEGTSPLEVFAGMVRDGDLDYARSRYYSPSLARFLSVDPVIGVPGIPASHNAYGYAANNPVRYRDPLGASAFYQAAGTIPSPSPAIDDMYDKLTKFGRDFLGPSPTAETKAPSVSPPSSPSTPPARVTPLGQPPAPSTPWVSLKDPYQDLGFRPEPLSSKLRDPVEVPRRPVAPRSGPPPRYRLNKVPDPQMQSFRPLRPDRIEFHPPGDWANVGDRLSKIWTAYNVLDAMSHGDYWGALNTATQELVADMIDLAAPGVPMRGTLLVALTDANVHGVRAALATYEADQNQTQAEQTEQNLVDALTEAVSDPNRSQRIIPFRGEPLPPVSNDPGARQRRLDEIIRRLGILLDILRNNFINNRRPLDGILTRPQRPGNNDSMPPAQKLYEDKLAEARELIRRGRELSSSIESDRVAVEKMELGVGRTLKDVTARLEDLDPLRKTLDELIDATKRLNELVAEMRRAALAEKDGTNIVQADWDAVIKMAEKNANTICGWAETDGPGHLFGPSSQLADRDDLKKAANDLIRETAKAIEDAEKPKTDDTPIDPPSDEELQAAINRVKTLKDKLSKELKSMKTVGESLAAAKKIIDQARTKREKINRELNELDGLNVGPKVNEILAPYVTDEAIDLKVQADNIQDGLGPLRNAVGMMNRTKLDVLLGEADEAQKKLDGFVDEAEPAIADAESALENAQKVIDGDPYTDPVDGRNRAYKALQRALECYSKIKKPKTDIDISQPGSQELTGTIGGTESTSLMRRQTPRDPRNIQTHSSDTDRHAEGSPQISADSHPNPSASGMPARDRESQTLHTDRPADPRTLGGVRQHMTPSSPRHGGLPESPQPDVPPTPTTTVPDRHETPPHHPDSHPTAPSASTPMPTSTRVTVPNVIGLSATAARRQLAAVGLSAGFQIGTPASSGDKPLHVYKQQPAAGTQLAQGGTVQLTIHSQHNTASPMPPRHTPSSPPVGPSRTPPPSGHHSPSNDAATKEGFRPGDGALVGKRFAAARVSDGDQAPYVDKTDNWIGGSAGPATVLYVGPDWTKAGLNKRSYSMLLIRKLTDSQTARAMFNKVSAKHRGKLPIEQDNRKVKVRHVETDNTPDSFGSNYDATIKGSNSWCWRIIHVIYRDEFIIMVQLGEPQWGVDFQADIASAVENAKKLIDMRFPKKNKSVGRFQPGDGAKVGPPFAAAKLSDGATAPYNDAQGLWTGPSAGPNTVLCHMDPARDIDTRKQPWHSLVVRTCATPEVAKQFFDKLYASMQEFETSGELGHTQIARVEDSPTEKGHRSDSLFEGMESVPGHQIASRSLTSLYRDRFVICVAMSGPGVSQDMDGKIRQFSERAKKLVDERFPKE